MNLFLELKKIFVERKVTRHVKIALTSTICRIIFIFLNFFNVKLLTTELGITNYSFYTILMGLLGWFALLDLGIGSSLQNYISEQKAIGKSYDHYIQNAFLLGILIAIPVLVLSSYFLPLFSENILENFTSIKEVDKIKMLRYVFTINIIYTVSNVITRVWFAEKNGHFYFIVMTIAALISTLLIWSMRFLEIKDKLNYAIVFGSTPPAILLCTFFIIKSRRLFRGGSGLSIQCMQKLIKRASGFWLITLLSIINANIDSLLVAKYTNSHFIVSYNLVSRFFSNSFIMYNQLLLAAWPILSEKMKIGDIVGVKEKLVNYIALGILAFFSLGVVLYFSMPFLVAYLTPGLKGGVPSVIIILFTIWYILRVWSDTLGILFSAASQTKTIISIGLILVPLSAFLQIFFIRHLGDFGITVGIITAYLVTVVWFYPIKAINLLKSIKIKKV